MNKAGYKTKQKLLIENLISDNADVHYTVDSLTQELSKKGTSVGRTTVYRCLEKMAQEGKVRKYVNSAGESVCYQYITNADECREHFHLKCEKCGKLIHVDCKHIDELSTHIEMEHSFSVDRLKTVLYGICGECRNK
ncbi:MAG: transcriptional repressor [Clostridia bacterium]|nr:transcriptional repressor [Clostridia bacterium]